MLIFQPLHPFFGTKHRLWLSDGDLRDSKFASSLLEVTFLTALLQGNLTIVGTGSERQFGDNDVKTFLSALVDCFKSTIESAASGSSEAKVSICFGFAKLDSTLY